MDEELSEKNKEAIKERDNSLALTIRLKRGESIVIYTIFRDFDVSSLERHTREVKNIIDDYGKSILTLPIPELKRLLEIEYGEDFEFNENQWK